VYKRYETLKYKQMIIDRDTILPFSFLLKSASISQNVGKIITLDGQISTGIIVKDNLLLTCNYCIPTYNAAKGGHFQINFMEDIDGTFNNGILLDINPDEFFYTSKEDDLTIVAVGSNDNLKNKFIPIKISSSPPVRGRYVNIIHHPGGEPLKYSRGKVLESNQDHVYYDAPTRGGSGGAPVFNDFWELIGIHERGGIFNRC